MGSNIVTGSFKSSDFDKTIRDLQREKLRYLKNRNGEPEIDMDYYNYSGTILGVHEWYLYQMHDYSAEQILKKSDAILDKAFEDGMYSLGKFYRQTIDILGSAPNYRNPFNYMSRDYYSNNKFESEKGILIEGRTVGYDLYRVTSERFNALGTKIMDEFKSGYDKYIMVVEDKYQKVKITRSYDDLSDKAKYEVYSNNNKAVVIDRLGNATKYYNTIRSVKTTTQKDKTSELRIKPIREYVYMGCSSH